MVWLNGPFGAGKTTVAQQIVADNPLWRIFDPEMVGFLVRSQFQDFGFADFQQLRSWRRLTPIVADEIARETGQHLVITQTVLDQQYWRELVTGTRAHGHTLRQVLLDVRPEILRQRICDDEVLHRAAGWRLEHLSIFLEARTWMAREADLVVDTSAASPRRTALSIADAIGSWVEQDKAEQRSCSSRERRRSRVR
ncbi:ATP-binding protein [Nocardia sp. NBC_01377]|uniref:AAA family ATPase n=1 Tax=Nocardia sp. NBC_01377 TaxID=2903595 RepID=UPI00324CF155